MGFQASAGKQDVLVSDTEDSLPDKDCAAMINHLKLEEDCAHSAVCDAKAELSCERCGEEDYCGEEHQQQHLKVHKKACFPKGVVNECWTVEDEDSTVVQDSDLLALPYTLLVRVCKYLRATELVELGLVCRHLRSVARDTAVWKHVRFPDIKSQEDDYRILRFAPALHTLNVFNHWTPVNLLRCTKNVKVLDLSMTDVFWAMVLVEKLVRMLKHFQGHLQVLKLRALLDMELLHVIDTLNIRELYIGEQLVKTYPGSSKFVITLDLGYEVSAEVASDFITSCRETLVSLLLDIPLSRASSWLFSQDSAMSCALKKCSNLETVSIPLWGEVSMLNSLPKLRRLCLHDMRNEYHDQLEQLFLTSPVIRRLRYLSVDLGSSGHRGLIKAVALGGQDLEELNLVFSSHLYETVDVPRDLHVLLGHLGNLKKLTLSRARIPFTVFKGIAAGALPNLTELNLYRCAGTEKARAALALLEASRADLLVTGKGDELQLACRYLFPDEDGEMDEEPETRCEESICWEPSDCDENDPVFVHVHSPYASSSDLTDLDY